MISRTSLETAKVAQVALWVVPALWVARVAPWVAQVAQVRCLGEGRLLGRRDLGVWQGRLLLHEESLRLLHSLQ